MCLVVAGEMDRARPIFERSLGIFRQLGDSHGVALGLYGLAATRPLGADAEARSHAVESLDILRAVGDRRAYGKTLWALADITADLGDVDAAAAEFEEALTLFVEFGDRWFGGIVLESSAYLAATTGDADPCCPASGRCRRDPGSARAYRCGWGSASAMSACSPRHASCWEMSRFAAAWEEGRRIPLDAALELVAPARKDVGSDAAEDLTARELEVLALVADGLTDAEVAERLVVSIRTVHAHLRSIYRKIDVRSRSAATRYALEHGLVSSPV